MWEWAYVYSIVFLKFIYSFLIYVLYDEDIVLYKIDVLLLVME